MNNVSNSNPVDVSGSTANQRYTAEHGIGIREFVILAVVIEHGLSTPEYLTTRTGLGVRPLQQCIESLCERGLLMVMNPMTGAVIATRQGSALVSDSGYSAIAVLGDRQ